MKALQSRTVVVSIKVLEQREGEYGEGNAVATHEVKVPLPAKATDIGATVVRALDFMAATVEQFRGGLPEPASSTITPSTTDDNPFI